MKKITLLVCLLSAGVFAQQSQSYLDATAQDPAGTEGPAIITSQTLNPVIETFDDLGDFTAAVAGCNDPTLTSEDFMGGPGGITACGPVISSAGDGCFAAGELEDGFSTEASNATDVVYIPAGAIGNIDPLVGATSFAEYTIINFDPNVYAVGMDIWENNEPITQVRIFDAGGNQIELLDVSTPTNTQTFFGFISDEPISKVELEGDLGSGELYGNFLFGADCGPIIGFDDNLLEQVSVYPNPATNYVAIDLPAGIELQSIAVYDVLGKLVTDQIVNNRIDVSQLPQGVYLLNVQTTQGTLTRKISKR